MQIFIHTYGTPRTWYKCNLFSVSTIYTMSLFAVFLVFSAYFTTVFGQCPYNNDFGVNSAQANQIVKLHNDVRLKIAKGQVPNQPRGVNLKRFVWDTRLAAEAQKIANTCVFAHKTVHDPRFAVGQNLYMAYGSSLPFGPNWSAAVNSWYQEYRNYRYGDGFSLNTGHYTQLVWANTKYVGCGYTTSRKGTRTQKLYVCNYGPAGNVQGQLPYRRGTSGCENLC